MLRAPSSQVGPFRLLRQCGSGGMGEVFEAVNENTGQLVALKLLSRDASREPQVVARFLQEGRALVKLDLPDVVRAFHCEKQADQVFLVMELLDGQDLRKWMGRHSGRVPRETALALCAQVARVMAEIHAKGIVHRDLKPENVFLCTDASSALGYRVKLLDFGIAKLPPYRDDGVAATQVHTHENVLIGTYHYTAPEQLRSASSAKVSADVYSLGVMLFELLAGQRPFESEEMVEVISAHVNTPPPFLGQLAPTIPGALATFVASMLAKSPEERPTMARCRDMLLRPWAQEQDVCPVPGLASFNESQAELFFGRGAETRRVLESLDEARSGGRRWVSLEGPSGVGKSSLLHAGVLPRLREPPPPGLPRWVVVVARPSYEPVRSLAKALVTAFPTRDADAVERGLRSGPEGLRTFVQTNVPEDSLMLLVVEPLEELFTSGSAEQSVLDGLLVTALSGEGRLRLLTCLRSDFLHRLEQLPRLPHQLQEAMRFPLLPMGEAALKEVVEGMARQAGMQLSEGLAERMVRDAKGEGGGLPLLGHALRSLWTLSGGAPLTHEHYDRMGGVGGALSQQAEQLLASLGEQGRERAKWILLSLVQVGRGVQDTRRPRPRSEVLAEAGGDALAEEALLRLSGLSGVAGGEPGPRLVLLSGGAEVESQRVDLVHETLLQRVRSLVAWLEEERRELEVRADVEVAARNWEEAARPNEWLPRGTMLTHYQGGVGTPGRGAHRLSPRANAFLQAASWLERRRVWTGRALVAAASLAVVVMLGVTVQAWEQRERADQNLHRIMNSAEGIVSDADWELSWIANTLEVRRALLRGLSDSLEGFSEEEQQRREVLWQRIKLAHRMADLSFLNDTLQVAGAHLLQARNLLTQGEALGFGDEGYRMQWAFNQSKQGKVDLAAGRLSEARALFLQSVEYFEAQRAAEPRSVSGDRDSAVGLSELADLELAEGHVEGALRWIERAVPLFSTRDPDYGAALYAQGLAYQAEVMRRAGRLADAHPRLDEAMRLMAQEASTHAGDHHRKWMLEWVRLWSARLASDEGRWTDAAVGYTAAVTSGRELVRGEPTSKRFALALLEALRGAEALALRRGDSDQAEALRREGCALVHEFVARDPEDVRFKALACESFKP
ncbi:serine/threonine-protein kinase [Myxococcus sp. XM-1-1-1]|uniref:serine/threonine-protein kinase n=1 Tax=Myxococcus sp. XM-1-1-1 TaxID=2874602 RepID=UPI001CC0DA1C|nr:serine/threonine-protein kinase [Myxococcus sp. XM-1-1-1]